MKALQLLGGVALDGLERLGRATLFLYEVVSGSA